MSMNAMVWALGQPIDKSSLKFVLVALANYAGPNGECYPSIPRLSFDTGQDDRTVRRNLRELAKQNYIIDTGRRVGRTKQIPVFILSSYADFLSLNHPQKGSLSNPPKNGSLSRPNPPIFASEPSHFCTSNPPQNGRENLLLNQKTNTEADRKSVQQRKKNAVHISELLDDLGGNKL